MKLKNTSNKAISVGGTCILPGETREVDDVFASNASVKMMERIGNLEVVRESQSQEEVPEVRGTSPAGKSLSRLSKDELMEECRKLGIETTEDDTKDTLVKKIKDKTAE